VILRASAVRIEGDDIDTDVLYPGPFLNIEDPEQMREHLFEGLDPGLRDLLVGDTALVVDHNFGSGSSREHVPQAMRASGVRCLVGASFARIFHRNCVNLGLLVVLCPEAVAVARTGSELEIDSDAGRLEVDGQAFAIRPIPSFLLDVIEAGGLVEAARRRSGA
jgi:3-isopropylmalate/(R)-2-methylmalate dehydratase small subunit